MNIFTRDAPKKVHVTSWTFLAQNNDLYPSMASVSPRKAFPPRSLTLTTPHNHRGPRGHGLSRGSTGPCYHTPVAIINISQSVFIDARSVIVEKIWFMPWNEIFEKCADRVCRQKLAWLTVDLSPQNLYRWSMISYLSQKGETLHCMKGNVAACGWKWMMTVWFNILRRNQKNQHFTYHIFSCIFLNEK